MNKKPLFLTSAEVSLSKVSHLWSPRTICTGRDETGARVPSFLPLTYQRHSLHFLGLKKLKYMKKHILSQFTPVPHALMAGVCLIPAVSTTCLLLMFTWKA